MSISYRDQKRIKGSKQDLLDELMERYEQRHKKREEKPKPGKTELITLDTKNHYYFELNSKLKEECQKRQNSIFDSYKSYEIRSITGTVCKNGDPALVAVVDFYK